MSDMNVNRNKKIFVLESVPPYLCLYKNNYQRHINNYLNKTIVLKGFFVTFLFTTLHCIITEL